MDNNKKFYIAFAIAVLIIGIFTYKYVIMYDTEGDDSGESKVVKNEDPALTLKADKEAEKSKEEKKDEDDEKEDKEDKDKKSDKDKDEDKKIEAKTNDDLKKSAKENALTALKIQNKIKSDFKKDSTQALFKEVATDNYVKTRSKSYSKQDVNVKYKNVSLEMDEKELKKDKPVGTLKFDRLINPKKKDSKIKPSTEVDAKVSVTFKKEDNQLKVSKTQV